MTLLCWDLLCHLFSPLHRSSWCCQFAGLSRGAGLGPVALKVVALLPLQAGSCLLLVLSSGWQEHLHFFLPACCFQVQ